MNYRITGEGGGLCALGFHQTCSLLSAPIASLPLQGFANPLPFRMAVAFEDSGTTAVTYVLLKLDAEFSSKL